MEGGKFWQVTNAPPHFEVADRLAQDTYNTLRRRNQPGENLHDTTFAGAVRPQKAKGLSTIHNETDIVHCHETVVDLTQSHYFYCRLIIRMHHKRLHLVREAAPDSTS